MHLLLLLQYSYRSAVLHPPAWLSWSYHRAPRCIPPSAQLHSWLEAGDPLEAGTHLTVAVGERKRGRACSVKRLRMWRDTFQWYKLHATLMWQHHNKGVIIIVVYLWENIRSDHASPPLTGHPICWPQRQWSFTDICWDRVDHSSLHRTCIGARKGLVEAHHRWARSRHNLVISIVIGDRRLGWRQDGVGQVWSTRARVRLLPAQLPSIIHWMLPVKRQRGNMLNHFLIST